MKYFVVADVHGFYTKMNKALKAAGFDKSNPEHIFVSLGDAMDRGEQPEQVLQFMLSLPEDRRILIRGNHEDLMEDAINRRYFYDYDLTNGTQRTAFLLTGKRVEFDALDDLLVFARVIAVSVSVFTRVEFIKLLLPISQRGGGNTRLLFGLTQRVIYFLYLSHYLQIFNF